MTTLDAELVGVILAQSMHLSLALGVKVGKGATKAGAILPSSARRSIWASATFEHGPDKRSGGNAQAKNR